MESGEVMILRNGGGVIGSVVLRMIGVIHWAVGMILMMSADVGSFISLDTLELGEINLRQRCAWDECHSQDLNEL